MVFVRTKRVGGKALVGSRAAEHKTKKRRRRPAVRLQEQIDRKPLDRRRIVPQHIAVVQILIAQREREHPLTHQRHHLVLDQRRAARVPKARRKTPRRVGPFAWRRVQRSVVLKRSRIACHERFSDWAL